MEEGDRVVAALLAMTEEEALLAMTEEEALLAMTEREALPAMTDVGMQAERRSSIIGSWVRRRGRCRCGRGAILVATY